jgi:hypothetical protein
MSYSYPNQYLNDNPPRTYIYSSNYDTLILDSQYNDTRLRFINSFSDSNLNPSFILSSSNQIFSIIKNQTPIVTYSISNNNPNVDIFGTSSSSNVKILNPTKKAIILQDYNIDGLSQFAGIGFYNGILNYQLPSRNHVHAFYAASGANNSVEWMRIQEDINGNPQVGIGITNLSPNLSLQLNGNSLFNGNITACNISTPIITSPTEYIDFDGKQIINTSSTMSFSNITVDYINSFNGAISFKYNNLFEIDNLVVRSNITVLNTGLNSYSNLPINTVFTNNNTGKIIDTIISSNIPRLQDDGTLNPALFPPGYSSRSTLLRTNDKVGIGLRNPAQKLHVFGNQCITGGRLGIGTTNPIGNFHIYDNNSSSSSLLIQNIGSTDFVNIYGSNDSPVFNILSTRNVGISSSAPLYKLDVNGKIRSTDGIITNYLESDNSIINCSYNFLSNIYNLNSVSISTQNISSPVNYIDFNNISFSNVQNIYSSLNKTTDLLTSSISSISGIGNITVNNALNITNYDTSLYTISSVLGGDTNNVTRIGLKVNDCILARSYLTISDQRIKTDINLIDSEDCLNKILKIPIKSYKMIDNLEEKEITGLIAQELEEIIPSSVKTTVNAIPSINRYIIPFNENSIYKKDIPLSIDLNINKYFKFYDLIGSEYVRKIINIKDDIVEFNESLVIENGQVFIYGEYVRDFKLVNYEALIPFIISAIQELNKKVSLQSR